MKSKTQSALIISKPVLILNADYSVLTIRPLRRVLGLYCQDKVRVIKCSGKEKVHNNFKFHGLPTVVVLKEYVYVPYRKVNITRKKIFQRDSYRCLYCGKQLSHDNATVDHIIPKSHKDYPGHVWTNVVTACGPCNAWKDNNTPKEAGMSLSREPFEPKMEHFYTLHEDWKEFIII